MKESTVKILEVWVVEYKYKGVWGITEVFTSQRIAEANCADWDEGKDIFEYRVRRYVPDPYTPPK